MNKIRIVYIAGLGRNGGTLLDRILGSTPGFTSLGEVYFLWAKGLNRNELCNCGEPLRQCSFWSQVLADTFGAGQVPDGTELMHLVERVDKTRWIPSLLSPLRPPGFGAGLERYRDVLGRLSLALHERTDGNILVDSSKFASHAIILSQIPDVDLRVLHLVRDSRAAAFSWMKKKPLPAAAADDAYIPPRYGPVSSSVQWLYRNLASHLLRRHARAYMRVKYEDFAADPRATVERIVGWAGAPNAQLPFVSDKAVQLISGHTQSGNPNRFKTGEVTIRPDMKWIDELPRAKKALITAITWPLLLTYGYQV